MFTVPDLLCRYGNAVRLQFMMPATQQLNCATNVKNTQKKLNSNKVNEWNIEKLEMQTCRVINCDVTERCLCPNCLATRQFLRTARRTGGLQNGMRLIFVAFLLLLLLFGDDRVGSTIH
jgi:hypothetical protein